MKLAHLHINQAQVAFRDHFFHLFPCLTPQNFASFQKSHCGAAFPIYHLPLSTCNFKQ